MPAINIPAGDEGVLSIAPHLPKMKAGSEYHAELHFKLADDAAWATKGFEIASSQFVIENSNKSVSQNNFYAPATFHHSENSMQVKGKNFSANFDRATGALNSYLFNGKEQIHAPLLPHFTRPQTDNDKRGWKTHRVLRQWYGAGLNLINISTGKFDGKNGSGIHVQSTYSLINDSATVIISYEVFGSGIIQVNYKLQTKPGLPNIPKVGMQMGIKRSYDNIEWFGKGPMENYIDKNYGADAGIYTLPIDKFMENYVVPQENGNRTDVRWMFLNDPTSKDGLLIVADSLLSMSAWPYTEENIQNAKHTNKLKDAGFITLNIDLIQMGVGGNDSWSDVAAPLEKYQIKAKDYQYSFFILPFNAKNKSAGEKAKEIKN